MPWPPDAPLAHQAPVREISTGRSGVVVGYSRGDDGSWIWAVHMHDDDRVSMIDHADVEAQSP
jgi:hypothetical protein